MKTIVALLLLFSPSVFAASKSVVCHVGSMGSDGFKQITIKRSGVEFQFHETSFSVAAKDLVKSSHTIAIVNKSVTGSVEGDSFTAKVDSLLVYNPRAKSMHVTVLLDGNPDVPGETFDCK